MKAGLRSVDTPARELAELDHRLPLLILKDLKLISRTPATPLWNWTYAGPRDSRGNGG